LSAALLTAATGAGLRDPCELAALREFALREFVDFLGDEFRDLFDEPRERAWGFFDPVDRFDEARVLV